MGSYDTSFDSTFKPAMQDPYWPAKANKRAKIARLREWAIGTDAQLDHGSRELLGVKEDVAKLKATVNDPAPVHNKYPGFNGRFIEWTSPGPPGLTGRVKHLEEEIRLLKTYLKVERDDRPEQKRMVPVKKGRK